MVLTENARRLVLRFEEGQYTFSRFDHQASDEQLYGLGNYLNSLQEDPAEKITKVQVFQLMAQQAPGA